jgi:NADH:ubiquinone oxidoreductase subunit 6 (subunit J)
MNDFPATEYVLVFVFTVAVAAVIGGAMIAVGTSRIVHSVCGLAICCFGLAGLYYFLHSPFLSLMEILIYVGAICVTIIFAVMLAEPDEGPSLETPRQKWVWRSTALVVSGLVFWGIARLGLGHQWIVPARRSTEGQVQDIGLSLMTTYSLAFELISLVLLVAILGALVVARYGRTKP